MKKETKYKCKECGYISYGYFGKCSFCGAWNSLEEVKETLDNKKTVFNCGSKN